MTAQQITIISEDTSPEDLNFMEYLKFFFQLTYITFTRCLLC